MSPMQNRITHNIRINQLHQNQNNDYCHGIVDIPCVNGEEMEGGSHIAYKTTDDGMCFKCLDVCRWNSDTGFFHWVLLYENISVCTGQQKTSNWCD